MPLRDAAILTIFIIRREFSRFHATVRIMMRFRRHAPISTGDSQVSKSEIRTTGGLGAAGFLLRFIGALLLVLVTYNPSHHSAYHWISRAIAESDFGPMHLILVAVLLIGWVVYWIASWRALGMLGVILAAVLLGAVIWLLIDIGLLRAESVSAVTWIILVAIAMGLAIGVSWSHIWRRLTGQLNVEDVDD